MTTETPEKNAPAKFSLRVRVSAASLFNRAQQAAKGIQASLANIPVYGPKKTEEEIKPAAEPQPVSQVVVQDKAASEIETESGSGESEVSAVPPTTPLFNRLESVFNKVGASIDAQIDKATTALDSLLPAVPRVPKKDIQSNEQPTSTETTESASLLHASESEHEIKSEDEAAQKENDVVYAYPTEETQAVVPATSFFGRVAKTFNAVKSSKPLDAVSNWVKSFVPAKPTPRIVFPHDWSEDLPESISSSNINEGPDDFGYFPRPVEWNVNDINKEIDKMRDKVADQAGLYSAQSIALFEELDEAVIKLNKPAGESVLRKISSGILGRHDFTVQYRIEDLWNEYSVSNSTKDAAKVLEKAAARWWNWGPLKYLPVISSAYQQLVEDTEKYFESPDVASEKLKQSIQTYSKDEVDQRFNYYRRTLGECVTRENIEEIFTAHEGVNKFSNQMNDFEEYLRLKEVIREHEIKLADPQRKSEHAELGVECDKFIKQAQGVAKKIKDNRNIIVPEITRKAPAPLTQDEAARDWGMELGGNSVQATLSPEDALDSFRKEYKKLGNASERYLEEEKTSEQALAESGKSFKSY